MHTPKPPHRAALGVCLVAAFVLLIGVGPIVASHVGQSAEAAELTTATDTSTASTTSSSTTTEVPPPIVEEVAATTATPPPTTSSSTTSTTVAPPPPAPEPEPEPAPEPAPVVSSSNYPTRTDIPDSYWDRMAQCETGGNWAHYPGARWSGGLGIYTPGWLGFGGGEFAPSAGEASREQQIVVANRIAAVGLGGWGCLSSVGHP